ncbi:hypothetical protein TGPRC2_423580 [Toxoplasma gondii TgCatPRC2]|uniref:Uncharacterized protein n=1 Tax=Toxoplasma gondii TgCatPRC2 TaxID=1130821 RepID=A0A151HMD9_TOXGO|nr:hypothetical protein TGPRC2_423580 [Toxoplasma gondii TgCatPRC2]
MRICLWAEDQYMSGRGSGGEILATRSAQRRGLRRDAKQRGGGRDGDAARARRRDRQVECVSWRKKRKTAGEFFCAGSARFSPLALSPRSRSAGTGVHSRGAFQHRSEGAFSHFSRWLPAQTGARNSESWCRRAEKRESGQTRFLPEKSRFGGGESPRAFQKEGGEEGRERTQTKTRGRRKKAETRESAPAASSGADGADDPQRKARSGRAAGASRRRRFSRSPSEKKLGPTHKSRQMQLEKRKNEETQEKRTLRAFASRATRALRGPQLYLHPKSGGKGDARALAARFRQLASFSFAATKNCRQRACFFSFLTHRERTRSSRHRAPGKPNLCKSESSDFPASRLRLVPLPSPPIPRRDLADPHFSEVVVVVAASVKEAESGGVRKRMLAGRRFSWSSLRLL